MSRATLTALLIAATLGGARARAAGADDAYQEAKRAYLELKADPDQRKFRHCWQNVARRFEAVAKKFPKSDRAADATFMCGELDAELYRFSQNGEDLALAEKSYRRFLEQWPRHKLADDVALSLGRLLADRGQGAEARRVVTEALAGATDRKRDLKALLDALPEEKRAEKKPAARAEKDDEKATAKQRSETKDGDERAAKSARAGKGDDESSAAKTHAAAKDGDAKEKATKSAVRAVEDDAKPRRADAKDATAKTAARAEKDDEKAAAAAAKSAARAEKDDEKATAKPQRADAAAVKLAARAEKDEGKSSAVAAKPAARAEKDEGKSSAAAAKSAARTEKDDEKASAKPPLAVATAPAPARAEVHPYASRDAGTGTESVHVVLDAIQRASNRALAAAHLPGQPLVPVEPEKSARRVAPARPSKLHDDEAEATDDVDEGQGPVITALQEKLRDVRVGARRPDDPEARARFKSLAKDEQAAELTLAQQLGLKVRRVVLDAGHGGHDTGAIGPKGTYEKDAALAITLKLAKRLEAMGLEVLLTRDDDSFVALEDRTRFANREKGDLFISIHCNAATSKALRGIETYTLNTSSNRYSVRLAARENATSERGVGDLQYILADLATKANTGESTRLAQRVQQSLIRGVGADHKGVRDLGTKEALFFVLLGAKMPAILVETSFISNPEEEQLLGDADYQRDVAGNIADAVKGFLEERSRLAQVD